MKKNQVIALEESIDLELGKVLLIFHFKTGVQLAVSPTEAASKTVTQVGISCHRTLIRIGQLTMLESYLKPEPSAALALPDPNTGISSRKKCL